MHHKRGRAKNRRAGCLLCKPQKANHASMAERALPGDRRRMQGDFDFPAGQRVHEDLAPYDDEGDPDGWRIPSAGWREEEALIRLVRLRRRVPLARLGDTLTSRILP
jgi:hypothetical protein